MAKVVIPLFYHLDRRIWTDSLTATTELTQIEIGQSNTIDFAVRFCNAGVATQLTSPAPVWICAIKAINDFAGVNLLLTTIGVLTGTLATSVYTFTLLIDSEQLRSWLLTVTGITALASLEIRDTNNNIATLPALTCSILPDYTLVGTTPTSASGTLVVASGKTFTVSQTFAMPTDNGTIGFVLRTDGAGVGTWVANTTGSVTSVGLGVTGGGTVLSITGTPVTSSGTLGINVAGTSGGLLYFSGTNTMGSSGTLGLGALIVGGGPGSPPSSVSASLAGRVLISNGTSSAPMYSTTPTLGASGTLGTIAFGNAAALGGILTITPPTGLYSSATITLPSTATTLAGLAVTQAFTQVNTFSNTTSSSSPTSGALLVSGGIGVASNIDAISSANGGAMTIAGGLAVGKKLYVGTSIDIVATTSTAGQITQGGTRILHTFGTQNLFIGKDCGNFTTLTGASNVVVSRDGFKALVGGARNTGIGDAISSGLTTGYDNTIAGCFAGQYLVSASENTVIGKSALSTNVSSNRNTAIGMNALGTCIGAQNIGLGFNAGFYITGTAGVNGQNTCLGNITGIAVALDGSANLTDGTQNTFVGFGARSTSGSSVYRTSIGANSICQSDNAIKLGRDTLDKVIIPSWATAPTTSLSAGMLYYDTTLAKLRVYTTAWETITSV